MFIQKKYTPSSFPEHSDPIGRGDKKATRCGIASFMNAATVSNLSLSSLRRSFTSAIAKMTSFMRREVSPLSQDPALTLKRLNNGFTYYVRKNNYPYKGKADFHLVIRAGMLNETEKELGIAHLIEHIATIDTAGYPKDQIRQYLHSKGVVWGRDQNAYTAPEETVYTVSIPLDDPEILEKTLSILSEVAAKATLSDELIENERKIVIDELQFRNTATSRLYEAWGKLLFQGTPYTWICKPSREEIKSIQTCPSDTIRSFYKRWYQAENMALIGVGDFEAKKVAQLVEKYFSELPSTHAPGLKRDFKLKEKAGLRILSFADPELKKSQIEILYQLPKVNPSTKFDKNEKERDLKIHLINIIFQQRLNEIAEEKNADLIRAKCYSFDIIPNQPAFQLSAHAYDGQISKGLKRLLLEIKRMRQHGILPSELEVAKQTLREELERLLREKSARSSQDFIERYKSHFLQGKPIPDIHAEYEFERNLIEEIDFKGVSEMIPQLLVDDQCLITISTPRKKGAPPLKATAVKEWVEEMAKQNVGPLVHKVVDEPLMKEPPAPQTIGEPHVHQTIHAREYRLKNGLRLLVKQTESPKDEVVLFAYSRKGTRTGPRKDWPSARFSTAFFDACGLGDFDAKRLTKFLLPKQISYDTGILSHSAWWKGEAALKDLETLFQLIHLQFTKPRYERIAFEKALKKKEDELRNLSAHPDFLLSQVYRSVNTQNHPEFKFLSLDDLSRIDYETCKNFHRSIFSNPKDFTLIAVGNVKIEKIKELAERYLATIPAPNAEEKMGMAKEAPRLNSQNRNQGHTSKSPEKERADETSVPPIYSPVPPPPGIVRKSVVGPIDSNALAIMTFTAPINESLEENRLSHWCCDLLKSRLNRTLRFEMGTTYVQDCEFDGHATRGLNPHVPSKSIVTFTGAPENLPSLEKNALDQIRDLQENGPTEQELSDLKTEIAQSNADALQTNHGWVNVLKWRCEWALDQTDFKTLQEEEIQSLTASRLKEHFKKIFPLHQYTVITQIPKTKQS